MFLDLNQNEQNKDNLSGKEIIIKPYKRKINQLTLDGFCINTYNSIRDAEKMTGISHYGISDVLRGRLKTSGGFKWEYTIWN